MARVWITDGSPVPFSDSHRLRARHPALLGLRTPYKGLVDPRAHVGSAAIDAERADDVLYVEAEWCLLFPGGIQPYLEQPDRLELATPVVMQGLVEGKWLNRLLGTRTWGPATLGNNLLAEGPGIFTTIGAIEAGAEGEVEISYRYQCTGGEHTQVQRTTLRDLQGQNIVGLARDALRLCRETGQAIDGIDLSAMGEAAAVVNERRRIRTAMRLGVLPVPNPWYLLARHRLMERLVRDILTEGTSVPPRCPVSITTRDHQGTVVGRGTLTWRAAGAREGTAQATVTVAGPRR